MLCLQSLSGAQLGGARGCSSTPWPFPGGSCNFCKSVEFSFLDYGGGGTPGRCWCWFLEITSLFKVLITHSTIILRYVYNEYVSRFPYRQAMSLYWSLKLSCFYLIGIIYSPAACLRQGLGQTTEWLVIYLSATAAGLLPRLAGAGLPGQQVAGN